MEPICKDVFISHHTESSSQLVQTISNTLEAHGITCWYAPRDVMGADYVQEIVDAIRQCRVFLLVLNGESGASGHVLNEINVAFDRYRKGENITLLPFRTDNSALSDPVYYYLGRIHMMDGTQPPQESRIQELLGRVESIVKRLPQKVLCVQGMCGSVDHAPKAYRLVGSAVHRDSHFVGREAELEHIHSQLQSADNKLLLAGMGGIGKSEIARAYCNRYRDCYDVVLWICFQKSLLQTFIDDYTVSIQGMERTDYPEDDDITYFRRKLKVLKQIADRRVLLVIDNFDLPADSELKALCDGEYSMILTSRFRNDSRCVQVYEILPITDRHTLFSIFKAEYPRAGESAQIDQLIDLLGGHPLSIRLIASIMKSRRITPDNMLRLLQGSTEQLRQNNASAAQMIFTRLREVFSLAELTLRELLVLKNLALLPFSGIEVETLYQWCGWEDYEVIDGLIDRNWVRHVPETDMVSIHPLICRIILDEVSKDPGCCDTLLQTVVKMQQGVFRQPFEIRKLLTSCLSSICEKLPQSHPMHWEMQWSKARMLSEAGALDESIPLMRSLLDAAEAPDKKVMLYNRIAQGYYLSGKAENAITIAQQGVDFARTLPPEAITRQVGANIRSIHTRMAEAYRLLKEYDLAVYHARLGLEGRDIYYARTPQDGIAWSQIHLAKILFLRNGPGDLQESKQLYQDAPELFAQIDDRYSAACAHQILGQICMQEGDVAGALNHTNVAYTQMKEKLGEVHRDIAACYVMWGNIYRSFGEASQAQHFYGKAQQILQKLNREKEIVKLNIIIESGQPGYLY